MTIYLKDLLKNPRLLEELRQQQFPKGPCCCGCGIVLQETITGRQKTPEGEACSDCYYESLGELVEDHPIVSAGIRRS
jgi:hypothetical protein